MGAKTRYRPQPDSGYDVRVTDLSATPFNATGAGTGPGAGGTVIGTDALGNPIIKRTGQWVNRNVSNTTPWLLQPVTAAFNGSVRALPNNPLRTGCLISNKDPANTINYSWGNDAGALGAPIGPGGTALFDFTTPGDVLYLFNGNAAILQVVVIEIVRGGSGN